MSPARRTWHSKPDAIGGCFTCHGDEAGWYASNTMAVAARHHDATGHTTWCEQTITVTYGDAKNPYAAAGKENRDDE